MKNDITANSVFTADLGDVKNRSREKRKKE